MFTKYLFTDWAGLALFKLVERHTDRPKSPLSRDGVSGGISHYEAGFCYLIVIPTGAKRSGGISHYGVKFCFA